MRVSSEQAGVVLVIELGLERVFRRPGGWHLGDRHGSGRVEHMHRCACGTKGINVTTCSFGLWLAHSARHPV